jgi:hypothetical protein
MADLKISALTSAGALAGTEPLPIVQGGTTKKTTAQDIANLKATPNLQQVTTAGATTSVGITVDNGTESIVIKHDLIKIVNASGADASITSPALTTPTEFRIPNKLTSPQTFAMLSDVTSGTVTSVNAGTNISVTGTATAPIINSLADRYKTSSLTSVLIGNNSKTFTVDANLAYIPLQEVLIVYDPSNHMHGTVTSYSGTTLVVDVNHHTGGGTFASWVINLDGIPIDAITGAGTANELAYFTSGQVIASLNTATYPSLTELALVKGVTGSAIQTQINGKMTNPMTTGGDIIYGGTSGVPTRLPNGTAGQVLQSNGTTLAPSWVAASGGGDTVAFAVMGTIITSPLDSTSYYFGIQPWTPNTTAAFRAFKFTDAGTVEKFSFALSQTLNGSNQTVTIYLRNVTAATDYSIGTFASDFGANSTLKTLFSGLSIAVNTTDDWTVKILTPAWGTNPSDWVFGGIISVTK